MIKEGDEKYYYLYAVIIMPDHVHLILTPKEDYSLSRIMKGIKGKSARRINENRNEKGSVWQDESFDRILRNEEELFEKLHYMLNNPFKAGLTDDPWNYHGWYFNEKLKR
jgi:putative transposase